MPNALSRRLSIQIISLVCVIYAVLQAASVNIGMMLAGRSINGVGVGMMDVSVPI
jgi:predicted MFS family arabinose efflux permease